MLFKDRGEAGSRLAQLLLKDDFIASNLKNAIVVSLLRGGIIVGDIIAKKLKINHLPLVAVKISAPNNPELAIGALCFQAKYLNKRIVNSLSFDKQTIDQQIGFAQEKFASYLKRFHLKKNDYNILKNKIAILTDDGIATGATAKAALLFLRSLKAKAVVLAVPVAPTDFNTTDFDKIFILHQDLFFSAVSQFYQSFPQVEDDEVKKLITNN